MNDVIVMCSSLVVVWVVAWLLYRRAKRRDCRERYKASEEVRVMDLMFTTVKKGKTTFGELSAVVRMEAE